MVVDGNQIDTDPGGVTIIKGMLVESLIVRAMIAAITYIATIYTDVEYLH